MRGLRRGTVILNRRRPGQARPKAEHACVGCGKRLVAHRWTYCRLCHDRLERGIPVDVDDIPTAEEQRRLRGIRFA